MGVKCGATDFYIYLIFRSDGRPCYIGKGRGDRWRVHASRTHNPHLAAIFKRASGELPTVLLCENLSEDRAFEYERAWIAALGRKANGGPLVNMTDGGEGAAGYKQTAEANEKRRRWSSARKHTPEACAKIGNVHRGKSTSDQARERLRQSHLGKRPTAETRAKMSAARKGKPRPPEVVEKIRKSHLGSVRSAEARARMSAGARGKVLSESHRANIAASAKKALSDPEVRAKISAAAKAAWAKRKAAGAAEG